jgi:two-component system sensor histidine kinase GlrK
VHEAVEATRASRTLTEQLTLMERSTRQYLVLGDATLLQHTRTAHHKFDSTVTELNALPLDSLQRRQLDELSVREQALFERIMGIDSLQQAEAIVTEFFELSELAHAILNTNNRLIDRESQVLAATAERAQHMLLWQTLPLLQVALLVAVIITYLLTRPIRRMDAAIRRLGRGDYTDAIAIDGPGDLRSLGERLDWLRLQLFDLEDQKKRFLRHVSHELKTPLTSIREGSELLAEGVVGTLSPQQREIAEILRENSLRLQKMIENLLDYTAVQFQKPVLNVSRLDARPLVQEALAAYALSIDTKQIRITQSLAGVTLECDREKLLTVIDNLISNAVKYTPKGGNIHITLAREGERMLLDVADDGPGIAAADRERLFEPFFRGSGIHDGRISGSGLGLSIAREYLDAHGGEISLLPSARGAHFRVSLPLRPKAAA